MDDIISRADAIEQIQVWAVNLANPKMLSREDAIYILESMPTAESNKDKYERHYDHTDCLWYHSNDKNEYPSTCAQYRDGWNDAMDYIFHDGEGYRPYRRGEEYEE